jgi:hypothetical protein
MVKQIASAAKVMPMVFTFFITDMSARRAVLFRFILPGG